MTESGSCRWCGREVAERPGPGRPREFCRRSCRQRDYEARRRAAAHGLDESEIMATRAELDAVRDQLFVLRCAVADVERDLAATRTPTRREYAEAVAWLLAACRPLLDEPPGRPAADARAAGP